MVANKDDRTIKWNTLCIDNGNLTKEGPHNDSAEPFDEEIHHEENSSHTTAGGSASAQRLIERRCQRVQQGGGNRCLFC